MLIRDQETSKLETVRWFHLHGCEICIFFEAALPAASMGSLSVRIEKVTQAVGLIQVALLPGRCDRSMG